ncbi:MAG: type II secretion system protein J [Aquabacterium sp.]
MRSVRRRRTGGFTLVEVLVALVILAVMATLGWQGIDAMLRTREISQTATERTLRLGTVLAQWEQDLAALHDSQVLPLLHFDGAALRLTRSSADGVQLVVWSLRDGRWQRWSSPALLRTLALQDAWLASQQFSARTAGQLTMLDGTQGWRLHFFRGGAWSNAQSTGDAERDAGAPGVLPPREQPPAGVRLMLDLPQGTLVRDIALPPQRPV